MRIYIHYLFILVILFSILSLLIQPVMAESKVKVEYFYSAGCGGCAKTSPILDEIEKQYGNDIVIERIDVGANTENWDRWYNYGFIEVPSIVINNETKIPKEEITKEKLEGIIDAYLAGSTPNETYHGINWDIPLAFSLGFISVFTPCTAAALGFVFAYTVGSTRSTKEGVLKAFIFGMGLMTMFVIIGLLALIAGISLADKSIYVQPIVGGISIIIGLNLLGIIKSPVSLKPNMQKALEKYQRHATLLGLFFLGGLFQLVDMPCATPMFMVVLSKIILDASLHNFLLLFVFGFGVIMPFVILGIITGFTPSLANRFRLAVRRTYGKKVTFVSSLFLVALGIWLIVSSFF